MVTARRRRQSARVCSPPPATCSPATASTRRCRAIAEAAGAGIGSVYRQFPSKRELLAALVVERLEQRERGRRRGARRRRRALACADRPAVGAWPSARPTTTCSREAMASVSDTPRCRATRSRARPPHWNALLDAARAEGRLRADATALDLRLLFAATPLGEADSKPAHGEGCSSSGSTRWPCATAPPLAERITSDTCGSASSASGGARSSPTAREQLRGTIEADVAIVGAGYTGLWTAYYLKRAQPSMRVVLLEAERAGFGASGRNGGWVSGFFSGPARTYERGRGSAPLAALQRAMFETVDEIATVLERERIDADFVKAGQLEVALDSGAGAARARARRRAARARIRRARPAACSIARSSTRASVSAALGSPPSHRTSRACSRQSSSPGWRRRSSAPARGSTSRRRFVRSEPAKRAARAPPCARAGSSRATEGYTASLHGMRRALVPMNSSMIVTEPLSTRQCGADRLARRRAARRRSARVRLPAAHRRRSHRDRRARRALPLRLAHRRRRAHGSARRSISFTASWSSCSRRSPERRSSTPGRACSASRATGACRSTPIAQAESLGPAATSARASPRRTSQLARCATCCSICRARCASCRGSGGDRAAGSPSRCAGRRSAASTRCIGAPTRSSERSGRSSRLGAHVDSLSGRG